MLDSKYFVDDLVIKQIDRIITILEEKSGVLKSYAVTGLELTDEMVYDFDMSVRADVYRNNHPVSNEWVGTYHTGLNRMIDIKHGREPNIIFKRVVGWENSNGNASEKEIEEVLEEKLISHLILQHKAKLYSGLYIPLPEAKIVKRISGWKLLFDWFS